MMKLKFSLLLWTAVFCLYAELGIAKTFNCDAVDKLATVYANSAVSIEHDKNNKTCKFSVDGATSSKASQDTSEKIQSLMSEYYYKPDNFMQLFQRPDDARNFVIKLMGAANATGQLPNEALKELEGRDSKSSLEQCFDAVVKRGTVPESSMRNQVKCSVIRADNIRTARRLGLLTVEVESASMRWTLHLPLP